VKVLILISLFSVLLISCNDKLTEDKTPLKAYFREFYLDYHALGNSSLERIHKYDPENIGVMIEFENKSGNPISLFFSSHYTDNNTTLYMKISSSQDSIILHSVSKKLYLSSNSKDIVAFYVSFKDYKVLEEIIKEATNREFRTLCSSNLYLDVPEMSKLPVVKDSLTAHVQFVDYSQRFALFDICNNQ